LFIWLPLDLFLVTTATFYFFDWWYCVSQLRDRSFKVRPKYPSRFPPVLMKKKR
jgi:hypothetical protein